MTKEVSRSVNMNGYESYMRELAQQMRSELTENGFKSLETSDDVKGYMNDLKMMKQHSLLLIQHVVVQQD